MSQRLYGVVAEFETPEALLEAARALRRDGYTRLDAFTPFPVHGLEDAVGLGRSRLGFLVFPLGLAGAGAGLVLQWWTGAVDYPLVIGGKPLFALEPSLPIIFELAVLLSAFAAVIGMLALNGLPRLYHPVFQFKNARRASDDRFLLAIEGADPKFDAAAGQARLRELGALEVEVLEE